MNSIACALTAAALFGAALVTTYFALKHMDALSGARVSIPTATLLFWLASPFQDLSGWHGAAAAIFAIVGIFFPAAVTLLTFAANRRLGPAVTGSIGSTAPVFAVLGAALILGEPPGMQDLAATGLIVLGATALTRAGSAETGSGPRSALWLPWSAAGLRGLAQLLSKLGLTLWPNPFAAALVGYSLSAIAVWAAPALSGRNNVFTINRRGAAWFAVTGMMNGGAVLFMYLALASGPVYEVAPIVATYPLFALALSALVLRGETLNTERVAGVALTVGGVMLLVAR